MTRTIPGTLGMAELAALSDSLSLGEQRHAHRPSDASAVATEINRLHRSGHSHHYIAEALRVAPEMVASVLAEQTPG